MSVACLILWIATASFGLYLLAIWLIEYDKEYQSVAATRLPPPVLAGHVLVAAGGLLLWIGYLIFGIHSLAWYSVIALVLAATLGLTMAIRWLSVYRAKRAGEFDVVTGPTARFADPGLPSRLAVEGPPERNFPLPVVITHGLFAVTTLTLVVLTTLRVGGS